MTPAFSPGPQMTCGAVVGKVFSQIFDDLYEQCSLHIAEKMPSSVRFGVRPRIEQQCANSSALRPISAARSAVTLLSAIVIPGPERSEGTRNPRTRTEPQSPCGRDILPKDGVHGFRVRCCAPPRNDGF